LLLPVNIAYGAMQKSINPPKVLQTQALTQPFLLWVECLWAKLHQRCYLNGNDTACDCYGFFAAVAVIGNGICNFYIIEITAPIAVAGKVVKTITAINKNVVNLDTACFFMSFLLQIFLKVFIKLF